MLAASRDPYTGNDDGTTRVQSEPASADADGYRNHVVPAQQSIDKITRPPNGPSGATPMFPQNVDNICSECVLLFFCLQRAL